MKQGGAFLAIILAISGILHFAGPGGSSPKSPTASAAKKSGPRPHSEYADDLRATIQEFYGVWEPDSTKAENLASYWNVPDSEELTGKTQPVTPHPRDDVHFVVAILPDPLHTRLALVFDRTIEAIQEAAERKGYSFDRAIFPWDRTPPPQPDDIDKRREAAEVQKAAEAYPGLLIFRGPNRDANNKPIEYPAPLFVFIVGETPTSGIRKKQFQNALAIMSKIREGNHSEPEGEDPPATVRPLLILGPFSAGSLRSLKRELKLIENRTTPGAEAYVYSGSVTDAGSMYAFTNPVDSKIHFASFQDNDEFIRDRFLQFACHDGYDPSEVATLSEGDTAYGFSVQDTNSKSADEASKANAANATAVEANTRKKSSRPAASPSVPQGGCSPVDIQRVMSLRFPREISYFRAAYQDRPGSQQTSSADIPVPQSTAVTLNPEEIGTDDDAALPYAGAQTPATQEAVMVGIVSELNKHHTKFTMLYASDPLDQYFLARYLRAQYPRGRVVVTTPDLLLISQEDSSLRGVLSINTYPIVPGLSDTFCSYSDPSDPGHRHDDRLFVSSSSIGTFNAMLGLISQTEIADANLQAEAAAKRTEKPGSGAAGTHAGTAAPGLVGGISSSGEVGRTSSQTNSKAEATDSEKTSKKNQAPRESVPPAPYAEFATPQLRTFRSTDAPCSGRPLVWLTILGDDGFWPIAGLSDQDLQTADRNLPIIAFSSARGGSTEPDVAIPQGQQLSLHPPLHDVGLRLPPAWKIAYCLALLLLSVHVFLSLNGSILADSEPRAQFVRIDDWRDVTVIALGALALATGFVTILFSGGPVVTAKSFVDNFFLWLPFLVFSSVTFYDLGWLRKRIAVAVVFAIALVAMFGFEVLAWFNAQNVATCWAARVSNTSPPFPCGLIEPLGIFHAAYWSTRLLHFTSGVSPVLPILFLAGAGYWWMWQSLRGVTLVDRRRPRLPDRNDPASRWYRINDREAAELRATAHPFFFKLPVIVVLFMVGAFLVLVLDLEHPVQTIEGSGYDWTYTLLLGLMIATLIGCLLKLVFTWLKCDQILSGLDRMPLREAFSRMKHLSWHSFWNPGGSTLRATYKVLERGIECLERLQCVLQTVDPKAPIERKARIDMQNNIDTAMGALKSAYVQYVKVVQSPVKAAPELPSEAAKHTGSHVTQSPTNRSWLAWVAGSFREHAHSTGVQHPGDGPQEDLCGRIATVLERRVREGEGLPALMEEIEKLQQAMADTAAEIVDKMLVPWWTCDKATVVSEDAGIKKEQLPLTRALGEEYAALVYVNFLITVLLRMRTLVVTAIGMYVFIVLSMNVYPFEPHPALQTVAVALLALMGVAVGFVYAQMHRDPILSRLTSTASGELGWDFWLKLASAGAIPVFSLLAVQFPEISRFLFSWLAPALQAIK
jgi:hypothetical protein